MTSGNLPMLSGIKVIDMTQFVAGPTASRILAELGADVIKVELAPHGDRSRVQGVKPKQAPENAAPHSTYFFQHNHSKRGIALDFKNPRAREILKHMIEKADVFVENFSPGVMARAGFAYDELKRLNPYLVMCSITFAGQTGALSEKPGYDYIGQAYAGVTGMIGEADRSPAMVQWRSETYRQGYPRPWRLPSHYSTASVLARGSMSRAPYSTPTFTCTKRAFRAFPSSEKNMCSGGRDPSILTEVQRASSDAVTGASLP
jgi:crotonobetainyl-CoA:carnitine CoA-transferase CaiB-like acyl-CoA transferase